MERGNTTYSLRAAKPVLNKSFRIGRDRSLMQFARREPALAGGFYKTTWYYSVEQVLAVNVNLIFNILQSVLHWNVINKLETGDIVITQPLTITTVLKKKT